MGSGAPNRTARALAVLFCLIVWQNAHTNAEETSDAQHEQPDTQAQRQYTFGWQFAEEGDLAPRGGTTTGPALKLDLSTSAEFITMTDAAQSTLERDRRAILAMAGKFRASFDFIETVGFTPDYQAPAPYQSWGTEYVTVVEEEDRFVSLQHILVMRVNLPSGEISDPFVMKHWRQDWTYEPVEATKFVGNQRWETRRLESAETQNQWLQSVYQVDDSPRYQSLGKWQHFENYSSWHSDTTWRPLPRREFSVRKDYDVLIGTNKHTINPRGWVQEEENLKVILDDSNNHRILAKEVGLARYERILDWDWSEGRRYWSETESFWREVRRHWKAQLVPNEILQISKEVDGVPLYGAMFRLAQETKASNEDTMSEKIEEVIERYTVRED
jgi:hypothetical protein